MILAVSLAILGGGGAPSAQRHLHVEAFSHGRLYRATVGEIPRGWPQKRTWEVPDGWANAEDDPPGNA